MFTQITVVMSRVMAKEYIMVIYGVWSFFVNHVSINDQQFAYYSRCNSMAKAVIKLVKENPYICMV